MPTRLSATWRARTCSPRAPFVRPTTSAAVTGAAATGPVGIVTPTVPTASPVASSTAALARRARRTVDESNIWLGLLTRTEVIRPFGSGGRVTTGCAERAFPPAVVRRSRVSPAQRSDRQSHPRPRTTLRPDITRIMGVADQAELAFAQ